MTVGYAEGIVQPWERNLWVLWAAEKPGRHWASCRIVAKQWQGGWLWQLTTLQGFDRIGTYMWCQSFSTCHFQFVLLGEDICPQWHLEHSCQCHSTKDTEQSVGCCTQGLVLPVGSGDRWPWDVPSSEGPAPREGWGESWGWHRGQAVAPGVLSRQWRTGVSLQHQGQDTWNGLESILMFLIGLCYPASGLALRGWVFPPPKLNWSFIILKRG